MKPRQRPSPGEPDCLPPSTDEKTSVLLRRILAESPDGNVRIGHLVKQLRRRSFGGILLLLSTLGLLPAISFFAGLAMIMPGLQMLAGFRAPRLPRAIREREIPTRRIVALGNRIIPYIEKLERFVRPRWLFLTVPPVPSLIGLLVIGLAFVLMLPLPFSNLPPAMALYCLSIGLMERDGALILIGMLIAVIALTIGFWILGIAVQEFWPLVAERLR